MNVYEIWNKISSHQVTGLMYHFQFADMLYFLGFDNLGKDQECHYHKESKVIRENHHFVMKHHNKIITSVHIESVELIPSSWSRYTTIDVDKNTRKTQIMNIFNSWLDWEIHTKEFYTDMYNKAKEQHAIADACRIKEMILDVEDELVYIRKCIHKMQMHDYSVEAILSL